MKTTRIFIIIVLAFIPICAFSQFRYTTSTEVYNGNTYEIHDYGSMYSVTNNKYMLPTDMVSGVSPYPDEMQYSYWLRMRNQFMNKIDSIKLSVFTPAQVVEIKRLGSISTSHYWDTKTHDYVGVGFAFAIGLKDIVTLEKLYEIEQKLANAHLNAGEQHLSEPEKKYFLL